MEVCSEGGAMNRDARKLAEDMFKLQPFEVAPVVFDYFAAALQEASQQKLEEFFTHFRTGVLDAIEARKQADLDFYGPSA